MVFRRVTAEQFAALVEFCAYEEIAYELKTLGKKTLMFGLPREVWRRLEYASVKDIVRNYAAMFAE